MSSPSRTFTIIDQALNLQVLFQKKRVEGLTSVRMCLSKECLIEQLLQFHLCAKQMNITAVELLELDLYNKETKAAERIDEKLYTKHWYYPEPSRQLKVIKANLDKCPSSVVSYREMMKKIFQQENIGFLKLTLELTTKLKEKIEQLFQQGYLAYVTVKVAFNIDEPIVAGSFLHSSQGDAPLFLKSNKISLARCLFPCLDYIDDFYRITTVKVSTDLLKSQVFCYGKLLAKETRDQMDYWVFDVNKILNPNYLCLMIGRFEEVRLNLKGTRTMKIFCQSKNLSYRVLNTISDHVAFFNRLIEFEEDILRIDLSKRAEVSWVYLDCVVNYSIENTVSNDFVYRGDSLFFYNTVVLDVGIVIDKKCMDTNYFNQCEVVLRYMYTLHLDKLAIKSHNDYWIFTGACQFIADVYLMIYSNEFFFQHVFENKKKLFYRLVEEGKDINPLNSPDFMHPAEVCNDACYNLKACLIFHLIFAYLKLSKSTAGDLASIFLFEDYDSDTSAAHKLVSYVDTNKAYKKIKHLFGITNLKVNLQQFLINTGTSELDCAYTYDKKGKRIKMVISQSPIQLAFHKQVMLERFNLEKYFNINSPVTRLLEAFPQDLSNLERQSEGLITNESKNAFLEDDGRILVNKFYNSLKYLSGNFSLIVTETNDVELQEEIYESKIEEKRNQEINFNLRSHLRRVVQKKGGENEIGNNDSDMLGGAQRMGTELRNDSLLVGGSPYLWIKFDPYNHFLRKVIMREGENIYLAQLQKELKEQSDLPNIYRILDSLKKCSTKATVEKLNSYISNKDIDQLIRIEMVNTLINLNLSSVTNHVSEAILVQIRQLKLEKDGSLKANDFNSNYYILNHLIDQITAHDLRVRKGAFENKADNPIKANAQTDEKIMSLLLTLLQKNDNSQNNFDDTFYQANILRSLFRSLNTANFNQILVEVDRFLKIEEFTHYDYKYLIHSIFSEFFVFLSAHFDLLGVNLLSMGGRTGDSIFFDLSSFNQNVFKRYPALQESMKRFCKLSSRYKFDAILCKSIFTMNFEIKKKIEKMKSWELLIWGLRYVEEARRSTNHFVTNKIYEAFFNELEPYLSELREMQRKLNMHNNKIICSVLIGNITCPYSYIDLDFRYTSMKLYRMIYGEYIPICNLPEFENFIFPLDYNWLSFKFELNFEKLVSNEKRCITLHYLSMENKKKTISGQTVPAQGSSQYNLRDLIFQNFKFAKESPTWRNLGKQIINVLASEKMTKDIEDGQTDGNDNEVIGMEVHLRTTNSLKEIKRRLMKPTQSIMSMEEFKDELIKVIDSYLARDYITTEVYNEYILFANSLIGEAEKILKEKAQKEEEKLRKQRVKM